VLNGHGQIRASVKSHQGEIHTKALSAQGVENFMQASKARQGRTSRRHTSSRPTFGGMTLSTTTEAGRDHVDVTRIRPQEGRAVDAGALAS